MARTETAPTHGWFPDPEEDGRLRMWDGQAWTSLTKYPSRDDVLISTPPPSEPMPARAAPATDRLPASRPSPSRAPLAVAAQASGNTALAARSSELEPADAPAKAVISTNIWSVVTLCLALVFFIVASITDLASAAVLPVLVGLRAYAVREKMAPLAVLAAAAAVVIGLVLWAK